MSSVKFVRKQRQGLLKIKRSKKSYRSRSKPLSTDFRPEQTETKQLLLFPISLQSENIFIRNQITF